MKYLLNLLLTLLIVTIYSCSNESTTFQNEQELEARSNDYYSMLYDDESYRELVIDLSSSLVDLTYEDVNLEDELTTILSNNDSFEKLILKWKSNLPSELTNFKEALYQFSQAPNDIQVQALADDGFCTRRRYYGQFEFATRRLDCDEVVQQVTDAGLNGSCCARLYCEEADCQAKAYLEAVQELPTDLTDAAFSVFVALIWQNSDKAFVSVGLLAAAEILATTILVEVGSILFDAIEMMVTSWWCTVPRTLGRGWSDECNCDCPRKPDCGEYYNPIFGGFNIPEDCD